MGNQEALSLAFSRLSCSVSLSICFVLSSICSLSLLTRKISLSISFIRCSASLSLRFERCCGPFGRVLVGGHHQQIGIREAIPIAPSQGAVAEGFSAGVQPDAAIVGPEGIALALA
jgi:hypothetical protein